MAAPELSAGTALRLELEDSVRKFMHDGGDQILDEVERIRHKYFAWLIVSFGCFLIFFTPVEIYYITAFADDAGGAGDKGGDIIKSGFWIWALIGMFCTWPWQIYDREARKRLMPAILRQFGDFTWNHAGGIEESRFVRTQLLPSYNRCSQEDFIKGTYHDGTAIELAEVNLRQKTGRSSIQVFHGLVVFLPCARKFLGRTIITTDRGKLGNWLKDAALSLERVGLVDPEFEGLFEVYSNDQVEARYLVNPLMMVCLVTLHRMSNYQPVQLAFMHDEIILTIGTRHDQFKVGSIFHEAKNLVHIEQTMQELFLIQRLAQEIKKVR